MMKKFILITAFLLLNTQAYASPQEPTDASIEQFQELILKDLPEKINSLEDFKKFIKTAYESGSPGMSSKELEEMHVFFKEFDKALAEDSPAKKEFEAAFLNFFNKTYSKEAVKKLSKNSIKKSYSQAQLDFLIATYKNPELKNVLIKSEFANSAIYPNIP